MAALRRTFRAEFLNRVSDVIVFRPLERGDLLTITENQLRQIRERAAALGVTLEWSAEALSTLAERGYDPVYGARALQRYLRAHVEDALAEQFLSGALGSGDRAAVSLLDGEPLVRRQASEAGPGE